MTTKVPRRPPAPLTVEDRDVRHYDGPLWRIHAIGGPHPARWDEARTHGPLDARWDPHPDPRGDHPDHAVLYAATDTTTSFGEVFWPRRVVDLGENQRQLTGWLPTRALRLLDLTDSWASRQGAAAALTAAPKATCRAWSRVIHAELVLDGPRLDGIWAPSTITGRPVSVLFRPALDAHPTAPEISRPLSHDDLVVTVAEALDELGYGLAEG